jgi:GDP-4-dehydro-6-deoxy-D-mannose reductase
MNALIIGAGGFVGKYLIDSLNSAGYNVSATKLNFEQFNDNICKTCSVYDLDICSDGQIAEILQKSQPDVVFHLAALSSVMISWKNVKKTFEINTLGAINLLESVRNYNKNVRIVLIGSSEEYGFTSGSKMPVSEYAVVNPNNPYAISKLSQSCLGRMYAEAFNMNVVIMRAFNHIGPMQPLGFVVPDFCHQIAAIERGKMDNTIITGNLEAMRDFTDVRDITQGYIACAEKAASGEIYNIGSGRAVSIKWILDYLCSLSTADIKVKIDPAKIRPIEVPVVQADITKITAQTGWKTRYTIEQSLENTLNYWRSKDNI